jgi:dihydrofolate synthase/folylpolyglutamate synthase
MDYGEALDWLYSTQMIGIKLGLEGPRRLLRCMRAHPVPGVKVVHVAGTNGKGSTCAILDQLVRSSGGRSGLFTSPHLVDYRERIRVNGEMIPKTECARLLTELRGICETMDPHPTFFEISLTLAMKWFQLCQCEWIVLETGMGGRLDATTAVEADVCVVTPIGMDHTQWLGDTLGQIAREKAGILLPGKPVVCSPQEPEAATVLEEVANELRCPLTWVSEPLEGYGIALAGQHQKQNAAVAVEAAFRAGLALRSEIVRDALARVSWPGRFERIAPGVVLDGAHNPHAAAVLAKTWREQFPDVRPVLVFSAVSAKDIRGILAHLAPLAAHMEICPVDTPRAAPAMEIAAQLPAGAPAHRCHDGFAAAFAAARDSGLPVLVAGSLFLVGEARAHLLGLDFQASTQ